MASAFQGAFRDKVALVTGGALGLGLGFARAFCEGGGRAALIDIDGEAVELAAAGLRADGLQAVGLTCDVADEVAVADAVARTVDQFGGLDVLINNAGLHSAKYNVPFQKLGHAETRRLFEVNIMGVVNCSLAARPAMASRGSGAICSLSSIAGYSVSSPYGVSKLAVRGLTIAFAREFADDRIRVNAVAPGLTATETIKAELPAEMFDQFANVNQLVRRTGQVEDVVAGMLFLCSDEASFITGETLKISGGFPLAV
ncbi:MAG: family oxidoreductase [Phenylobacterium sp.]|nr:family oxidoreductase [Phenylobacterium sp.]